MAQLLFRAATATTGIEPWTTDGTAGGTRLVADIEPGGAGSEPNVVGDQDFVPLDDGRALFVAATTATGAEPWVTDGTAAGTLLLRDIAAGGAASDPSAFTPLGGGRAVFAAGAGGFAGGTTLWVTDGTPAGTTPVGTVLAGHGTRDASTDFVALGNGRALFMGSDPGTLAGAELWITDGTATGTTLLKETDPGPGGAPFTYNFGTLGAGRALFNGSDGSTGPEPWVSDGTAEGSFRLADLNPGQTGSFPSAFTDLGNGRAVFAANGGAGTGIELHVTDGTAAGTALLRDINLGAGSAIPQGLRIAALGDGRAVFTAIDGTSGAELWITDGTAAGTALLKDINPGAFGSSPAELTALGDGRVLFSATEGSIPGTTPAGIELWITDGTAAGTVRVADLASGVVSSLPGDFAALGDGRAVFGATNGAATNGRELWITDGTAAGTALLQDINPGAASSDPSGLVAITPPAPAGEVFQVVRGGVPTQVAPTPYSGPVGYLQFQMLGAEAGEVAIGTSGNDFLNLLGGDDAADGRAGDDVLDGGIGSNFLTGGAGRDVFFLDGRGGQTTWATITDWGANEQLSVWGWRPGVSRTLWVDGAGAAGFEGVTLHADLDGNGQIDTSVTWTGMTRAALPAPLEFDGLLWFT